MDFFQMAFKFRQAREWFGAVNTLMRLILLEIFPSSEIKKYCCSINYGSSSDFLTSYGSGSTSQKVTVPTVPVAVPVPVPQHCFHTIPTSFLLVR